MQEPGPLSTNKSCKIRNINGYIVALPGIKCQATSRLLAAAYTSYDKHCGLRAVELAEGDLLGELIAACESLFHENSVPKYVAVTEASMCRGTDAIRATLAKIKGE